LAKASRFVGHDGALHQQHSVLRKQSHASFWSSVWRKSSLHGICRLLLLHGPIKSRSFVFSFFSLFSFIPAVSEQPTQEQGRTQTTTTTTTTSCPTRWGGGIQTRPEWCPNADAAWPIPQVFAPSLPARTKHASRPQQTREATEDVCQNQSSRRCHPETATLSCLRRFSACFCAFQSFACHRHPCPATHEMKTQRAAKPKHELLQATQGFETRCSLHNKKKYPQQLPVPAVRSLLQYNLLFFNNTISFLLSLTRLNSHCIVQQTSDRRKSRVRTTRQRQNRQQQSGILAIAHQSRQRSTAQGPTKIPTIHFAKQNTTLDLHSYQKNNQGKNFSSFFLLRTAISAD
jgi:hypothetical protein